MATLQNNVSLVAFVRNSLQFAPKESVALIFCTGTKTLCTLRFDLPHEGVLAQWARGIAGILEKLTAQHHIDGSMVIVYDENQVLKGEPFRLLNVMLERYNAPQARAVLVANGMISNWDGTDAKLYNEIEYDPFTVEMMVHSEVKRTPEQIVDCAQMTEAVQLIADQRSEEIASFPEASIGKMARQSSHELAMTIASYREAGEVTEEIAGWIAGTFTHKGSRDLAVAGLAGVAKDESELKSFLLGDKEIQDPKLFEAGAEMLCESLGQIAGAPRANVLCTIAWTHWLAGESSHALKILKMVFKIDEDHRLGNLFDMLIRTGKLPKTALYKWN